MIDVDGHAGVALSALYRLNGFDPDGSVGREVLAWIIADLDERLEIARAMCSPANRIASTKYQRMSVQARAIPSTLMLVA